MQDATVKETEAEETTVFFETFLSWVAFQLHFMHFYPCQSPLVTHMT